MINETEYLFVYGTLRKEFDTPIKVHIEDDVAWIGAGQIKGTLYDIGSYPGAVPAASEQHAFVKGEVVKILSPEIVFKILDKYEGFDPDKVSQSEYYRNRTTVFLSDNRTIEAWVYWYNFSVEGKPRIPDDDYVNYLKMKSA